ncbi:MAG: general secretion pathway protein GspF [Ectothiorhodospiraceae bacterium]|nr:general secretion pathway protein GspF [Ectothiorhodospiraceae bacterium]
MSKQRSTLSPDAPLYHLDHSRPVSRRDFLRQGFITGAGVTVGGSLLSLFANPRMAQAALSSDLQTLATTSGCPLGSALSGRIPFICFDLAGGANMVGSNVLVGGQGGYINSPLSTAGYSKMGIPGDMVPGGVETVPTLTGNGDFTDTTLGLPFHSDSAYLRGILEKVDLTLTAPNVNGAVIPARSDNDTGNNPHNPMYGIARTGADGDIVTLIGSRNSESGGNSMAPATLIDPEIRPTKVDRPSDVTGLVDTGDLTAILSDPADVKAVMESVVRLSDNKIANINASTVVQDLVRCGYINSADIADRFVGKEISPDDRNAILPADRIIVNDAGGIFTEAEFDGDREFRKTASVMKMVIDGHAGAGTVQMGGFDYHTGDRSTGEVRDLRVGRCIGACLEYARRMNSPVMIYVFSDGSVASNGSIDGTVNGRGKGVWTGDNSSTAAGWFLVFNPTGRPTQFSDGATATGVQIGWFNQGGSVVTSSSPAANNVNLLVDTVLLNYLALHGDQALFTDMFDGSLGSSAAQDALTAFGQITA